jgi:hypothetical protein
LFDSTGALIVTSSGGGGSNANITEVAGNTIAPTTAAALPVEIFDGTNPLGVAGNPLVVTPAAQPSAHTPAAPAAATVTNVSAQVVAANSSRTGIIYLVFGANAAVVGSGIALFPNGGVFQIGSAGPQGVPGPPGPRGPAGPAGISREEVENLIEEKFRGVARKE